jgi:hypothetical protein
MLHAAIQTFRCHSAIDFLAAPVSCVRMRIVQGQRMWLLNPTEHFGPDNSAIATLHRYYRCFYRGYKQTISSVSARFQNGGIEAVDALWRCGKGNRREM